MKQLGTLLLASSLLLSGCGLAGERSFFDAEEWLEFHMMCVRYQPYAACVQLELMIDRYVNELGHDENCVVREVIAAVLDGSNTILIRQNCPK